MRWHPNKDEIQSILRDHQIWLESEGREGSRAEIYYTDLNGVNLFKADLRNAYLWETTLHEADLCEADLSGVEGLRSKHLYGADLSGAKLPEGINRFEALETISIHTKNSRKVFFVLLLAMAYSWLTLLSITDGRLLSNLGLVSLPFTGVSIPATWTFASIPILLLGIYIYFQLGLQRKWESMAELPAIFPDGTSLDKKVHPWLLNSFVRSQIRLLRTNLPAFSKVQSIIAIFLNWWLVPCTISWFWLRYLTKHDLNWTIWLILIASTSVAFAIFFQSLARRTLRGKGLKGRGFLLRAIYYVIIVVTFSVVSFGAIKGVPPLYGEGEQTLIPRITETLGYNLFADFTNDDVSIKPENWTGDNSQIILVQGASMKGLDIPYTKGSRAFLVNADFRKTNLIHANLDSADLRGAIMVDATLDSVSLVGADLRYANLKAATLEFANLSDADLREANLELANLKGANLYGANLRQVKGLTTEMLHSAENWFYAFYGGKILDSLKLSSDHSQRIVSNDLSGYDLRGADFNHVSLVNYNLTGANLQGADLTGADLTGANVFNADFRTTIGLDANSIQKAQNWFFALYDENFLTILNLPPDHATLAPQKNLRGYNLKGVNLTATDLSGGNLRKADLTEAVLRGVDLRDADLFAASLVGADLREANFKGTILLDTDLRGANLTGVRNLTLDQIRWAIIDSNTVFPDYLKEYVKIKPLQDATDSTQNSASR